MRVAALAFGILAGIVASLILALGGLDATSHAVVTADRQIQLARFVLLLIGNLGIFGAALVLAAPLAGAILLLLGAAAWIAAGFVLHASNLAVLLTPPGLLALSAACAFVAHLRRPLRRREDRDEDPLEEIDEPPEEISAPATVAEYPQTAVGAGFLGQSQYAPAERVPLRAQLPPAFRNFSLGKEEPAQEKPEDWRPGKRRTPPPRQQPAFRDPDDDDDDEESGFARFARGISGVLSFALYAALAGAAVLVLWNIARPAPRDDAVAEAALEQSSSAPALEASAPSEPVLVPVLPSIEPEPAARLPELSQLPEPGESALSAEPSASSETPAAAPSAQPSSEAVNPALLNGVVVAPDPAGPALAQATSVPPPVPESVGDASSEPPATATDPAAAPDVLPFTMPPEIAAARTRPAPRVTTTAPARPADSGL